MKQVTMESVKERISDLQLADDTFGLGLNAEFELACLRELVAVTEQRDAVVAEFLQVKAINDDRRVFIMNGVQLGYIKVPTVETDPALETIRIAVSPQAETPATSSAIAALRAEGVEMAIDVVADCSNHICAGGEPEARQYEESIVNPHLDGIHDELTEIARQLRESKVEVQS